LQPEILTQSGLNIEAHSRCFYAGKSTCVNSNVVISRRNIHEDIIADTIRFSCAGYRSGNVSDPDGRAGHGCTRRISDVPENCALGVLREQLHWEAGADQNAESEQGCSFAEAGEYGHQRSPRPNE
jgi:hypothetical protein